MIFFTPAKLEMLGLAKQVVKGAFINSVLVGGAVVSSNLIADKARSSRSGLCKTAKVAAPQDQ